MATEPFGYGILGSSMLGIANATNPYAAQQMQSASNAAMSQLQYYYMPSTSPYITGTFPAKPSACEGCGRKEYEIHAADCWFVKDRCDCHTGRASKIHDFAWRLRREIEEWHGDVLGRLAAA